ncbi:MAG: helix-turn-helix domain-containing protein [Verrucomicrobiota bacterium]|nr:helix-turn-helix domain-containing protein [Verrucomicrobiota bacterium]
MPKIASAVVLSEADRNQLEKWVPAPFTPQQVALRSRILLMAADGKQDLEIAGELDVNRHTPALWRKRFPSGSFLSTRNHFPSPNPPQPKEFNHGRSLHHLRRAVGC